MSLSHSNGRILLFLAACALIAIFASLLAVRPNEARYLKDLISNGPELPVIVDINRASYPELLAIDGIGPMLAQRILSHRMLHGPIQSWDELDEIRGVGPAVIKKIRSTPGFCLGIECDM